jgi:hypothetical protein
MGRARERLKWVMKRHAGCLADTSEVPTNPDGIAAAPKTSPLCGRGVSDPLPYGRSAYFAGGQFEIDLYSFEE